MKKNIKVTTGQLALLYMYAFEAYRKGLAEDAYRIMADMHAELNTKVNVPIDVMESAVAMARELDFKKKFKHPHRLNFSQWVKTLIGSKYNYRASDGTIVEKPK
jgi:hypothetical protein